MDEQADKTANLHYKKSIWLVILGIEFMLLGVVFVILPFLGPNGLFCSGSMNGIPCNAGSAFALITSVPLGVVSIAFGRGVIWNRRKPIAKTTVMRYLSEKLSDRTKNVIYAVFAIGVLVFLVLPSSIALIYLLMPDII